MSNRASRSIHYRRFAFPAAVGLCLAALLAPAPSSASHLDATITQAQLLERMESGEAPALIDVRTPGEFRDGHVPGAINIPLQELDRRLNDLRGYRNTELVLYCESGRRAGYANRFLEQQGFTELRSLEGHMGAWRGAGLPAER